MSGTEIMGLPLDLALRPSPNKFLLLKNNDVHLWLCRLDALFSKRKDFPARILSADEKKRAEAISSDRVRRRFEIIRAELRILLAPYLEMEPETIQFRYGPKGKPYLRNAPQGKELHFSVSHSGVYALYAMTVLGDIGVDLERISMRRNLDNVAQRFFTANENDRLQRLSSGLRREAIYSLWCCKEAYAKAVGCGIMDVLRESNASQTPANSSLFREDCTRLGQAHVHEIRSIPGYACAVATAHANACISFQN